MRVDFFCGGCSYKFGVLTNLILVHRLLCLSHADMPSCTCDWYVRAILIIAVIFVNLNMQISN